MNEEIKSALLYLNDFINSSFEQVYINKRAIKIILDYINILEQEKHNMILDSNGLINANGILQQENAQLKDKIEKAINFVDKYMDEWDFQDEVWKDMNDLLILLKEN